VLEGKEFNRVIHHDSKLQGFMITKNQSRKVGETHLQRMERINTEKIAEMDVVLHTYTKSLREILRFSHFDSMEKLVMNYNEHEQRNFACFKFITDINFEVNSLV
jgi:hypothetical protein